MAFENTHDQEVTDPALLTQINEICQQFERELPNAQSPKIEVFLAQIDSVAHRRLLRELLLLEVKFNGNAVNLDSYAAQFPEMADIVQDIRGLASPEVLEATVDQSFSEEHSDGHQQTTVEGFSSIAGQPKSSAKSGTESGTDSATNSDHRSSRQSVLASDRYARQHLHATGGIGQVWVASDMSIRRDVALKELRSDRVGSAGHRERFLFEAQVTGQLEHPGIVPVYDLDADTDSPCYTMRFFRGRTLKQAIDEYHKRKSEGLAESVEFANLLNAFVSICNTIEYAHSRGVIHRDLKGQNVVLGDFGEVIVLDWGLAKQSGEAVDADENAPVSTDSGSSTQVGAVVGTPAYMSPEQACGQSEQVGPASDVYSLGVILFEILAGQSPFIAESTLKLLQKVIHEQPQAELLASAAPPLAAICLKALSKQPESRFGSPRQLADDVRRFLADEPVGAWREPFMARCARWARRHRTLVTTAAGVLIVAVLALSVGNILLADANDRVNTQRQIAEENEDRAERNFKRALGAVDEFLTKVSQNKLLDVPGMHPLRRELLESALGYYEAFAKEDSDNPAMQTQLANAHNRIGRIHLTLGNTDQATKSFNTAMALNDRIPTDSDTTRRKTRYLIDLGALHEVTGNLDAAMSAHNEAIQLLQQYGKEHDADFVTQNNLAESHGRVAQLLYRTQSIQEARKSSDAALEIYRSLIKAVPDGWSVVIGLAKALTFRGVLERNAGQGNAALQLFSESLQHLEPFREPFGNNVELRNLLSGCYHSQAMLFRNLNRIEEAEDSFAAAIELRKGLARDYPTLPQNWVELANSYNSVGVLHWQVQEWDEALRCYRLAADQQKRLVDDFPKTPVFRADLASTYNNIAMIHRQRGEPDKAIAAYGDAIQIRQTLEEASPNSTVNQVAIGNAFRNLGRAYEAQGDHQRRLDSYDKSIGVLEPLRERIGDDPRVVYHLRRAHWDRAEALLTLKRPGDAIAAWEAAWKYDDGRERDYIAMQVCHARASSGDHLKATAGVSTLAEKPSLDAETTYDGARVYAVSTSALVNDSALTAADRASLTDQYADRAVELLKLAQVRGHFNSTEDRERFRNEPDFEPIKDRKNFADFVKQLPTGDATD